MPVLEVIRTELRVEVHLRDLRGAEVAPRKLFGDPAGRARHELHQAHGTRGGHDVRGLAQVLSDDLKRGADDGVIARGPGGLLLLLDGGQVGRDGDGRHVVTP